MMKMKRGCSLLLALVMALGLTQAPALAAETGETEDETERILRMQEVIDSSDEGQLIESETISSSAEAMKAVNYTLEKPNYYAAVTSYSDLQNRLNTLINKYKNVYWTTTGTAQSNYGNSKYYYGWQCKGFGNYIFNDLFNNGNIGPYDENNKHVLLNVKGATLVSRKTNVGSSDAATVKDFLSQAQIGDYIQVKRRSGSGAHTMIVAGKSDTGITIFDCNHEGTCRVSLYDQTYATFASKNIHMSLYHATNYPTTVPSLNIAEGTYVIQSALDANKVVDVAGANKSSGTNVQLWSKLDLDSQKFIIKKSGSGYSITALHSGMALDVYYPQAGSGGNVWQYTPNGSLAQQWIFENAGNGYYYIRSALGNYYLDDDLSKTENGNNIWACIFSGATAQKWKLVPVSSGKKQNVATGTYMIQSSLNTSKVLDVYNGEAKNGQNILLWTNYGLDNQKYNIAKAGDYFTISPFHSGMMVDVAGASAASGTNIQQYEANGNSAQKWCFEDAGNGYVYIHSALGNYVDVYDGSTADGTNVWTYSFNGTAAQKWKLVPVSNGKKQTIPNGEYVIKSALDNSKVLDVSSASTANEVNIQLWSNLGLDSQTFSIQKNTDNHTYSVTAKHSGKLMDVAKANAASGTNIQQYEANANNAQKWTFEDAGDGYVYIRSALGTYVDVYNGSTADGTNILAHSYNGSTAQKWKLVPADENNTFSITTQPQNTTVTAGDLATIPVEATGEGLTYQWYTKNANQSRFYKSSVTSDTYTVTATEKMSGRQLYCVIKDANGETLTTDTVTLTVKKPAVPLAIVTQPQNTTVAPGEDAVIPLTATGEGLTYQWYTKNPNQSRFYKSSVTSDTYTVTATEKMSGRQLYCVVKDANGETLTSDTVTLTVEKPLAIITQPQSVTVAPGETATICVEAQGEGLTYQWYTKNANQSRFYKSSVTDRCYTVPATAKMSGRQLYCVVKDANGETLATDTVILTVR